MFQFKKSILHKVVYYEDAEFNLDYSGITTIRGLNKNALRAVRRTNGAGKSLLMQTIPNLVLNSNPILSQLGKRTSGVKGSLLSTPKSYLTLEFDRVDADKTTSYEVTKCLKGKSVFYKVREDGKELDLRTGTIGESYVSNLFPWSEEEFYTHQYIDGRRPSTLAMGSPQARYAFLSDMFRLDGYDKVREGANALIRELRDDKIRLTEFKSQLSEIESQLESVGDLDNLKSKRDDLKHRVSKYRHRVSTLQKRRTKLALYWSNRELIERVRSSDADIETISNQISKLKTSIRIQEKYVEYRRDLAKYEERTSTLTKILKGVDKKTLLKDYEELTKSKTELALSIDSLKSSLKELVRTEAPCSGLVLTKVKKVEQRYSHSLNDGLNQKLEKDRLKLSTKVETAWSLLRNMKKLEEGSPCFACGSTVIHSHKMVSTLNKQLKSDKKKLSRCKDQLKLVHKALAYQEWYNRDKLIKDSRKKLQIKLDKRTKSLSMIVEKEQSLSKMVQATRELQGIVKPQWKDPVPQKKNIQKLERRLSRLQNLEHDLEVYSKIKVVVEKLQCKFEDPIKAYKEHETKVKKEMARGEELVSKLSKLDPLIQNLITLKDKLSTIETKITKVKKRLKDLSILEMIADAYSIKQLKMARMQEHGAQLQKLLNDHADLIYHEPFRFELDIAPNKFDMWALKGKSGKKGEVRTLSGAESGAFKLLSMWALLRITPSNRRSNLLVLDEVDSGLDAEGRQIFIDTFLPELNKTVPHIVVITPLDDEYPGSRSFTAVKAGDKTKLMKGARGFGHAH